MSSGLLAIIGGTGIDWRGPHSPLRNTRDGVIETRWGTARVTRATIGQGDDEKEIVFLHRHSPQPELHIPPHRINYRANIAALKKLGVTGILASNAVGGLHPEWPVGTLVLIDQFIDQTSARNKTFFDDRAVHIDVTTPYCPRLGALLMSAATDLDVELLEGSTYICTDGPRFETPAEIRAFRTWGADVVGMTGVPEVVLAREANISYAAISIVSNAAAGILPHPLTQAEVLDAMKVALPRVTTLFLEAARNYFDDPATASRRVTEEFGNPNVL